MAKFMEIGLGVNLGNSLSSLKSITSAYKDIAAAQKDISAGGGSGSSARAATGNAYLQGPNQRLAKIREQMARAKSENNQDALNDLKILEFQALRSKAIGEKRLKEGDSALNAPGLLDLFRELNGLMKNIGSGNAVGAVKNLAAGFKLIEDSRPGGLNIAQKMDAGSKAGVQLIGGDAAKAAQSIAGASTEAEAAGTALAGTGEAAAAAGGSMLAMLGPLALVVVALVVAVAAAKMFGDNLKETARRISEVGQQARITGSNSTNIGRLQAMGGSAQAASALRDRLASDPMAMAMASRVGLSPQLDRAHGTVDEAQLYIQAAKGLSGISNEAERLRVASALGNQELLRFAALSDKTRAAIMRDGDVLGRIADAQTVKQADELNAALGRVGFNFQSLLLTLGKPFLKSFTDGLNSVADITGKLADASNKYGAAVGNIMRAMFPLITIAEGFMKIVTAINKAMGDKQVKATDKLNDTMEKLNRTLEAGMHGGGQYAQNAFGSHQKGLYFQKQMESGTIRNGAFGF